MHRRILKRAPRVRIGHAVAWPGRPILAMFFAVLTTVMPLAQSVAAADPSSAPTESPSDAVSPSPSPSESAPPSPTTSTDPGPSAIDAPTPNRGSDATQAGGQAAQPEAVAAATSTNFTNASWSGTRTQSQTFGYAVQPAPSGGTVSLEIDGLAVTANTPDPTWGSGSVSWTPSTIGTHQVQLVYSGTTGFAASSSPTYPVEIFNPPPASVTVVASGNPIPRGADVTFTVTVSPNPGSGSIEWNDGSGVLATVVLNGAGTAQYTTSYATTGQHGIVAKFTGNADWSMRTSEWFYEQVVGDGVSLTLSVPSNPMPAGSVVVTATVTPNPGGGTVRLTRASGVDIDVALDDTGHALFDLGTLGATYIALTGEFLGNETYGHATDTLDLIVWNTSSVSLTTNRTTATAGELPVVLNAAVPNMTGSAGEQVSFEDTVGGVTVTLGPVAVAPYAGTASLSSSALRVGVHTIRAHYQPGPGTWTFDAFSAPVTVTVAADRAVHVTFAPSLAIFYPSKEGFRDTVALGGTLDEKATVTVKVYSSTGSLKRSWSLGWKLAGKYSVAWNGRTASGTALGAGKYKVVASFKDVRGNARSITTYTTVSWRKAAWKSVTVLKYADAGTYYVADGGAIYYSNDYAHGRILDSGPMIRDCSGCAWSGGRFDFTVVSTSVLDYRSIYVQVRGHGFSDREHPGQTSLINPTTQALGAQLTHSMYDQPGVSTGIPTSKGYISSGHKISALVWMTQAWGDAYDLYYLKLTYQYAVWA